MSHSSEFGHPSVGAERARPAGVVRLPGLSYHAIALFAAAADGILIFGASVLGGLLYHEIWYQGRSDIEQFAGIGFANALIFVSLASAWGLYRLPMLLTPRYALARTVTTWAGVLLSITWLLFLLKAGASVSRGALITIAVIQIVLLIATRFLMGRYFNAAIRSGAVRGRRAIILGSQREFAAWSAPALLRQFGIEEVARVALGSPSMSRFRASQLSGIERAIETAKRVRADELVVALDWSNAKLLDAVRERLRISPLPVRLLPCHIVRSVYDMGAGSEALSMIAELQRAPLSKVEQALKRGFDICAAGIGLFLLSPLLLIVALAIKLESRGPVIFRQRRNGFNGNQFVIFKFRTMKVLEDGPSIPQATREDPRVTSVGRLLRRWSLDELPQLLNVMRGEMSFVGPRPHALAHDTEYMERVGNYAFRHHVKPGITGWAQVNGYRGETPELDQMVERIKFDLWYINNWSIWLDLRIVFRTCFEVSRGSAF
jgi:undecaprenyl-phosphate galactose phosphotransferase/putative colanic acid biosynthesis UDP-glucose lipid carrier transferase